MSNKHVVAVCGKGGVGKTAYTSMLTRVLADRNDGRLLVVDADPALGLNFALAKKNEKNIGSVREAILKAAEQGNKNEMKALANKVDYLVAQALDEGDRYSFLAMGRMNAIGCFCSVNDLLKEALSQVTGVFDTILVDGEAGLEQINRQVVENIDTLILVTDSSRRGMMTVKQIKGLMDDGLVPQCRSVGVVFNCTQTDVAPLEKFAKDIGVHVLGFVPYDKTVEQFDLEGRSLFDLPSENPALLAVARTYDEALKA